MKRVKEKCVEKERWKRSFEKEKGKSKKSQKRKEMRERERERERVRDEMRWDEMGSRGGKLSWEGIETEETDRWA